MKKSKYIVAFLMPLFSEALFGQVTFQKSYGDIGIDEGFSAQETSDAGYIIAGMSTSIAGSMGDFYLVKTDQYGNMLWAKTYGGTDFESATSVQETSDKGFIVAGYMTGQAANTYQGYLVKTDSSGALQWSKIIEGPENEEIYAVQQTFDGGYILTGWTFSFAIDPDFFLVKTDSAGNITWSKVYGASGHDYGYAVMQTADSGYIVCGIATAGGGSDGAALIKTDGNGNIQWAKKYMGNEEIFGGTSFHQTTDGGFIVSGSKRQPGTLIFVDALLFKTDAAGNVQWSKSYEGIYQEWLNSVRQTADGGYIAAGGSNSFGAINTDFFVIKTDTAGDIDWSRVYGRTNDHRAVFTQQAPDGGYAIAGYTKPVGANKDFFLIKTDSLGATGCNEDYASPFVSNTFLQGFNFALWDTSGFTASAPLTSVNSVGIETIICAPLTSGEIINSHPFQVYPNPASSVLNIQNNSSQRLQFILYNCYGEKIIESKLENNSDKIDMSLFPNGIYFYKLNSDNMIKSGKIVKQ